mgnify:CR=1 FL=1
MNVKRGTQTFCMLLASLPATNKQLADKLGCALQQAEQYTRQMRMLRLIHVSDIIKVGSARTAVFSMGNLPSVTYRAAKLTSKPNAQLIYFASIIRALELPTGTVELEKETGIHRRQLLTIIRELRNAKLVRIAEWEKPQANMRVPLYQLGSGPDAPKPGRMDRRVVNAGHWKRRKAMLAQRQVMFAVAGVADRMAA